MIRPTTFSWPAALLLLLAAPSASAEQPIHEPSAAEPQTPEAEPTTPALPPPAEPEQTASKPSATPVTQETKAPPPPAEAAPVTGEYIPRPRPQWGVYAAIATRTNFITSRGFEPFSTSSELPQIELSVGKQFLEVDALSIGLVGGWAYGSRSATLRGASSSINIHRLWLAPELRVHLLSRLVFLAQIAPGVIHTATHVSNDAISRVDSSDSSSYGYGYSSSENTPNLEGGGWTWGVDLVGGLSFELFNTGPASGPTARFWLTATGGYTFAGSTDVKLRPGPDESVDRNFRAVSLPSISPGGALMNLAFGISL